MLAAVLAALTANVRTQIVTVLTENAAISAQVSKYEYYSANNLLFFQIFPAIVVMYLDYNLNIYCVSNQYDTIRNRGCILMV